ncbi:MAG: response regulator [Elusimicrobiales bacterium]
MRQINVLLIEDNPGDAELTRQSLEASRLSVRLTVVDDGEKALKYLRQAAPYQKAERPDLVLLDLNLPKLPGGEVLRAMKGDKALRGIPVVVLTTSEEESEISRCYAEGANCYIVKPADFKSFMSIVSAIEEFWLSVVKLNDPDKARRAAKPDAGAR